MDYKYKISVIIPIYNVEDYLRETIESVVNQSIGFKENIQLILVNDGSPDNSERICLEYQNKYPDNVIYLKKENGGVSSARNYGIEYAQGKYINFLDSDDKWDFDAFKCLLEFFEVHQKEVDAVTSSLFLFGSIEKPHITNYRMKTGTRVADLLSTPETDSIVLQVSSSLIKSSAIKNIRFDESMVYGEDSLFINTLLLKKMRVGFVKEAQYYYRRREDDSSATQTTRLTPYYFIGTLKDYHLKLIELSLKKYHCVTRYIQNVVYYDLSWRFAEPAYQILSDKEMEEFFEIVKCILFYVDDSVILKNKSRTSFLIKMIAMNVKNGKTDAMKECVFDNSRKAILYNGLQMFDFKRNKFLLYINFCDIKNNTLRIEGLITRWLFDLTNKKVRFYLNINGELIEAKLKRYAHTVINTCLSQQEKFYRFCVNYSLDDIVDLDVLRVYPTVFFGKNSTRLGMNYGKFVVNSNAFTPSYRFYNNYYLRCFRTVIKIDFLKSEDNKRKIHYQLEKENIRFLKENGKNDLAKLRIKYFLYKLAYPNRQKIWLFADRFDNAGDNGEVFFKYVNRIIKESGRKDIRPIFTISKYSDCVDRLKSEGEVMFYESKEYLLTFLLADKIITSNGSDQPVNPFGEDRKYMLDLFRFKLYYLQHGVACADLSVWLQRFNKNIDMIFAVSDQEREGFLKSNYYYSKKQVVVTGQARFDELYDQKEKLLLILPTWRKSIRQSYDANTTSVYFPGFKETEYFKYYNDLINDERLLEVMRKHSYKGLFCMHPIHMKQTVDYNENDVFSVNKGYIDYNSVFARSALMVTDYSSVLFDFAYLRKPVIYTHFDKESFFAGQIYDEGYFNYERDGFGPVCYDLNSTVDAIIASIERNCENEKIYLDRLDSFFKFNDQNNCKRIFNAINKADKNR